MASPRKTDHVKKKMNRRAGACEPCRKHKIRCSGGEVCEQCQKRKRNKSQEPCWYDPEHLAARKARKPRPNKALSAELPSVEEESDGVKCSSDESDSDATLKEAPVSSSVDDASPLDFAHRGPPVSYPSDEHLGPYGMFRCINQFKKLSGASVDLVNSLAVVQCDSTEAFHLMGNENMIEPSELTKERQEHSLTYMISEAELQQASPNIQQMAWRAINIKDYQLDQGRIYEATFWQPTLTRPSPAYKAREPGGALGADDVQLVVEQKVYKLIVDLEVRTKMHIGIPLEKEIKSERVPVPAVAFESNIDSPLDSLEVSKTLYRQTALQVLELLPDFDIKSPTVEQYTELEALLKQLKKQQSAFIDVAALKGDESALVPIADYQIEHYSFAIMLACRLALCEELKPRDDGSKHTRVDHDTKFKSAPVVQIDIDSATVIGLCRQLLQVFMFITSRVTIKESHNWTRSYAAYSAAAMIAISSIQSSAPLAADRELVAKTVDYFRVATRELTNNFSALASERLEKLYAELNRSPVDISSSKTARPKREGAKSAVRMTSSRATSLDTGTKRKRNNKPSPAPSPAKRQRASPQVPRQELPSAALDYGQTIVDVGAIGLLDAQVYGNHLQTPTYADDYESSGPATASTSFDSSLTVDTPLYPTGYGPDVMAIYTSNVMRGSTFEYAQDWHPPIHIPHPPQLTPSWVDDQFHSGTSYAHHYNAQVMAGQVAGSNFPASTEYGASPVAAQMRAHGLVSPHDAIQRGSWAGNDDGTTWSIHPQLDTRRSSDAFSVDQMRAYGWDAREGHPMGAQNGVQPQHNITGTAAELMTRENSEIMQHHHNHVNMTTGGDWRHTHHYTYDNECREHWPAEHHGPWTTPVS